MTALEAAERHDDMVMVFEEFVSSHLGAEDYDPRVPGASASPAPMIIDLHGYSIPIAKGAVRSALNILKREAALEVEAFRVSGIYTYIYIYIYICIYIYIYVYMYIYGCGGL
jgi:hypothetical protein